MNASPVCLRGKKSRPVISNPRLHDELPPPPQDELIYVYTHYYIFEGREYVPPPPPPNYLYEEEDDDWRNLPPPPPPTIYGVLPAPRGGGSVGAFDGARSITTRGQQPRRSRRSRGPAAASRPPGAPAVASSGVHVGEAPPGGECSKARPRSS